MKRLLFIFIVLSTAAWAQISGAPGGSCAGTTSCTLTGTPTTKSLQIAFEYRSGSTSAPGTQTGWTSITTGSGTSSSWRVSCRVSSTTSVSAGTSTTNIVALWYNGTQANATANCNTTGIGATPTGSNGTSTTVTFAALTPRFPYDRIVAFMGGSASSICTPSGMTQIATSGTVSGYDTGSNARTWPQTTCTVSTENSSAIVIGVLGAQDALESTGLPSYPVDYYIDLNDTTTGDDTTTICTSGTCTPMANGTISAATITWTASNSGTLTGLLVSRQNNCPRTFNWNVYKKGIYPPSRRWRSIRIDHGDATGTGAVSVLTAHIAVSSFNATEASIGGCVLIGAQACDGGGTLVDYAQYQGATTGHSVTMQFNCGQSVTPAIPALNIESGLTGSTVHSNFIRVVPGKTYRWTLYSNYTSGVSKLYLYDPNSLAFVGEATLSQSVTPELIGNINIGNNEAYTDANCTGCNGHEYSYLEDMAIAMGGNNIPPPYPMGPGTNLGHRHTWKAAIVGPATSVGNKIKKLVKLLEN